MDDCEQFLFVNRVVFLCSFQYGGVISYRAGGGRRGAKGENSASTEVGCVGMEEDFVGG